MRKEIRYCDICKKEIDPKDVWNDTIRQARFPTFKLFGCLYFGDISHEIDLCPSCSYDLDMLLKNFMEGKDDTKESEYKE